MDRNKIEYHLYLFLIFIKLCGNTGMGPGEDNVPSAVRFCPFSIPIPTNIIRIKFCY